MSFNRTIQADRRLIPALKYAAWGSTAVSKASQRQNDRFSISWIHTQVRRKTYSVLTELHITPFQIIYTICTCILYIE